MADLFNDPFETGDVSLWSASQIGGGDLSVATAAKLHGSYGLSVLINDTGALWVRKDFASPNTRFRCRVYIDPNGLTMANGDEFVILDTYKAAGASLTFRLSLVRSGGIYYVFVVDRTDDAWNKLSANQGLTDEPHYIEVDWQASSAPLANNGTFSIWVDGIDVQTVTGIDSDTGEVSQVYLGVTSGLDAGTSGTFYLDDFRCNSDGGLIGGLFPTPTIALPGLGFNVASTADTTVFDSHVAVLLNLGIKEIRVNLPDWANASAVAQAKAACTRAIAVGADVIWGVSSNPTILTAANWADFSTEVQSAATWAQANGVFEFQIGNEETLHNDGTTLTDATLITNLKALATTVQAIFTRGNVSYTTEAARISDWVTAGKGDLDLLAANIYIGGAGVYSGVAWETNITSLINAFGASGTYLTEFNISYTSLADYSTDERVQATALSKMIEYIRASGITRAYYYAYSDATADGFGALKTTGIYRHLWQLMNFASERRRLTSVLGGISRTQATDRNVITVDVAQTITPSLGSELLTDPGLEAAYTVGKCDSLVATGTPTWTQSADVHGGSKAQQFVATAGDDRARYGIVAGTAGVWYTFTIWVKRTVGSAGTTKIAFYTPTLGVFYGPVISSTIYTQLTMCFRLPASEDMHAQAVWETVGAADTVIVDDGSLKANTLSSLVGASQTTPKEGTFQRPISVGLGYVAGFWMNWDGTTAGAEDYIEAIADRNLGTARLSKCVAGTITSNLVNGAITYVADAILKVVRVGRVYTLYYNGTKVGNSQIISDIGIINNTGFAAFQTDPDASGNIQYVPYVRTTAGARTAV